MVKRPDINEVMTDIIDKYGIMSVLEALIVFTDSQSEEYIKLLNGDLRAALVNYNNRHNNDSLTDSKLPV